ncbi:Satratoxin biosynthesis SC1 cluster protein 4 [Fusarium oxysporum f. sp. rapae]|uniref:Satratoxin biosynthesis SC1 cluster protein 4 n=1 Tax=Fusarium oxysporum f. sp. rapae TaxID=485398 RepID=A0A8J5TWW9_FUSOX|nr:Satratoxin biosynthesis SC1 cluster protein 4 [Fusarium oxysporum f. sp. rapae]
MVGDESILRDSDDSKVSMVIGIATFLLATSTLMVVLRVVSRAMVKQFRLDDMAAIASLLTMIACGTAVTSMTRFGLGRHISTVSSKNQILYLRCFWVSVFFYMLSLFFIKMSFLINYYRLLSASKLRPYCIGAMVLIVLWGGGVCILVFVMCIPLAGVWDPNVDAKCVPHITIMWWFNGVFNSIGDLFILTLPIPALWRLQLPRRQKAYLLFVFSLGFLTVGISIARMRWLKMDADMTWWNVTPTLWSLGELTSAISCSCLPFFKPLTLRVKSFMSRATVGDTHPQMTGGEGDKEANAHSSVDAGQKAFIQNSNLMTCLNSLLTSYTVATISSYFGPGSGRRPDPERVILDPTYRSPCPKDPDRILIEPDEFERNGKQDVRYSVRQ